MTDPTDLIARADEVLKWMSPGKPVQFSPYHCDEAKGAPFSDWDTSHDLSLIRPDGTRYRIGTFKHADDAAFDQHARQLVPDLRDALAAALTRAELAECRAEALEAEKEHASLAAWRAAFETAADIAERRINAGRAESVPESLRVQARIGEPEEDCAALTGDEQP